MFNKKIPTLGLASGHLSTNPPIEPPMLLFQQMVSSPWGQ